MDEDCNQGKDDYSDIQDRALGARAVSVVDEQRKVYVRSWRTNHSITYFCLNTAQYIHVVESWGLGVKKVESHCFR